MVSSTQLGAVTLRNSKKEEFKVNGQRLKHYLGEKQLEDKPLVLNGENLRNRTMAAESPARD